MLRSCCLLSVSGQPQTSRMTALFRKSLQQRSEDQGSMQQRPTLSNGHRQTPSFSDLSFGTARDGERPAPPLGARAPAASQVKIADPHRCAFAVEQAYSSQPVDIAARPVQPPAMGRHSIEACEGIGSATSRPFGLRRLSQALAASPGAWAGSGLTGQLPQLSKGWEL